MKLEQLHYLVQAYHWGSVNKAANYCHVSHQLIYRSLKQLEEEFNIKLFNKEEKTLSLTPEGEIIYQNALQMLKSEAAIINSLQRKTPCPECTEISDFNVLHSPGLDYIVEPAIYNIIRDYPQLYVNIHNQNIDSCREMLNSDFYDFIFLQDFKTTLIEHTKFASTYHLNILDESNMFFYASPSSPYASQKSVQLRDIKDLPMVSYSSNTAKQSTMISLLMENNIMLNVQSSVNSINTYCQLISFGTHYGIGSGFLPSLKSNKIVAIPIKSSFKVCNAVFINKSRINNAPNDIFYHSLCDVFTDTNKQIY